MAVNRLNFSPSPLAAPIAGSDGKATVAWNGWFTQFDTLQPAKVLGRAAASPSGPPQQLTVDELLGSVGSDVAGLTIALTGGGTSMTFDVIGGRICNAVVTP